MRVSSTAVRSRSSDVFHLLFDIAAMLTVIAVVTTRQWGSSHILTSGAVRLGLPIAVGMVSFLLWEGAYGRRQARRWPAALGLITRTVSVGAAAFSFAGFVVAVGDGARRWLLVVSLLWFAVLAAHHCTRAVLRRSRTRVIVAGSPRQAVAMRDVLMRDRHLAYEVVGFAVDETYSRLSDELSHESLGNIDDLPGLASIHSIDQVLFCMDGLTGGRFAPIARMLGRQGVDVSLTGLGDIAPRRVGVSHVEGRPVISISPSSQSGWRALLKRGVDVAVSASVLFMFAPLLAAVALAIRLVDGASPIFRQPRVGKGGTLFTIFKFQTMVANAEEIQIDLRNELDGPVFKMGADPRVTRLGSLLRKTSIDELPQLWNVLRGDMSLVGPRPFIESEIVAAPKEFRERESVIPGMTGHWQVSGRSDTDFGKLDELDRWYVDNWSLSQDLEILAKTVPAVLRQKGAR